MRELMHGSGCVADSGQGWRTRAVGHGAITGSVVDRAVLVNSLKTREGALEVFSQIDANRDGVLSLEEVEHAGAEAKEPRFACAGACVTITTAVLASSVGSAVGAVVGAVAHALVTKMLDDD